jgi:hypothetical protein
MLHSKSILGITAAVVGPQMKSIVSYTSAKPLEIREDSMEFLSYQV